MHAPGQARFPGSGGIRVRESSALGRSRVAAGGALSKRWRGGYNQWMEAVLLVEDDPSIAESLRISLKVAGYEMTHAPTARAGKQAVLKSKFAVILMDVNLPDGSGFDLCQEIREAGLDVPVILLTARADEESAVRGLSRGATDYVRKPFGTNELIARMKRFTSRAVQTDKVVEYGDLRIHLADRRALLGDVELALTKRELEILILLARRAGSPVPRAEVLAIVDEEGETNDRTLDSHVSNLRAKLKKVAGDALRITAVYGVGYKLERR